MIHVQMAQKDDIHVPDTEPRVPQKSPYGTWAKVQHSLWYVKSGLSASDAGKKVWSVMDSNDSLIVIDATNNDASWYNLGQEVSDFIKKHWHN